MVVLARSAQIEAAFNEYFTKRDNLSAERCLDLFRPWLKTLCGKHPLWLQDDLYQELSIAFLANLPGVMQKYREGKIHRLLPFLTGVMHHKAQDIVSKMGRDFGKFFPIDDADLAYYTHPGKEQEMRDLIAHVRKAINEMVAYRWIGRREGERASRWIQTLLKGLRPPMQSDAVARFNHTRYETGKHMYSVVLHRLRELFLAGGHEVT